MPLWQSQVFMIFFPSEFTLSEGRNQDRELLSQMEREKEKPVILF